MSKISKFKNLSGKLTSWKGTSGGVSRGCHRIQNCELAAPITGNIMSLQSDWKIWPRLASHPLDSTTRQSQIYAADQLRSRGHFFEEIHFYFEGLEILAL
jgi:hypothetical protein